MGADDFKGFPRNCVRFFEELSVNNDKIWFEKHKVEYDEAVLNPARQFIFEMGTVLKKSIPGIIADSRVNRSIFKIHRDVRFSKDKSPFKLHLGIWFWEGHGKRMDCSGFYFHIEPKLFLLGAGMHLLPQEYLSEFRNSLIHERHGKEIRKIVDDLKKQGYTIGETYFKKVPRGFDPEHFNKDLLLQNSLTASCQFEKIPDLLYTEKIIAFCSEHFLKMLPLHLWMRDMAERAKAGLN